VLIKQQHNVASDGKDYPLRLPRNMYEYTPPLRTAPL